MPAPKPAPRATWLGSPLTLRAPKVGSETPPVVARVPRGAELVVISVEPDGAMLVSFPPSPYLWMLSPKQGKDIEVETEEDATEPELDGELTPELLLLVLEHPNVVGAIKQLVATQPERAKAAAKPLIEPLVGAFAAPEHKGFIDLALRQFGIK